jgi:hypothetical protein
MNTQWMRPNVLRWPDDVDAGGDGAVADDGGDDAMAATDDGWLDSLGLPTELRTHPTLETVKSPEGLIKSYIDTHAMVGNRIPIPKDDADDEAWAEVYTKLGRPDDAAGYEFPTEGLPENIQVDEQMVEAFREEAHRLGLNKQQAAALYRFELQRGSEAMERIDQQRVEARKQAEDELRKEFGNAFDQEIRLAKGAVAKFGGDELSAMLDETGLGDNPHLVRAFAKIGRAIAEDEILGEGAHAKTMHTARSAKEEIDRLENDREFQRKLHGGDAEAKRLWEELFSAAYPGERQLRASSGEMSGRAKI